jgi:large subunit ribosomal protein L3
MSIILARKLGMTTIITESGDAKAVTVLQALKASVSRIKNISSDGYDAIVVEYDFSSRNKKQTEFRLIDDSYSVGSDLDLKNFNVNDKMLITSTSKGKGFAGTIKRHNFKRGPKTHGSHNYRAPGSIGAMYPEHVFKGKKMAGQMGGDTITLKNIAVADIDINDNLIILDGPIPGANKSIVKIQRMG